MSSLNWLCLSSNVTWKEREVSVVWIVLSVTAKNEMLLALRRSISWVTGEIIERVYKLVFKKKAYCKLGMVDTLHSIYWLSHSAVLTLCRHNRLCILTYFSSTSWVFVVIASSVRDRAHTSKKGFTPSTKVHVVISTSPQWPLSRQVRCACGPKRKCFPAFWHGTWAIFPGSVWRQRIFVLAWTGQPGDKMW